MLMHGKSCLIRILKPNDAPYNHFASAKTRFNLDVQVFETYSGALNTYSDIKNTFFYVFKKSYFIVICENVTLTIAKCHTTFAGLMACNGFAHDLQLNW